MAVLWLNAIDAYTIRWSVSGLSSAWHSRNYMSMTLSSGTTSNGSSTPPSGAIHTIYPPTSGTSTQTPSRDLSASPNTTYFRYAYARAANGLYYFAGSASVTTPSPPAPSSPTITSAYSTSPNSVYMSWNSVSGATMYQTVVVGQGNYTNIYGTSTYFTNLQPNTSYTFGVCAYNGQWSNWSYRAVTTPLGRPLNLSWQLAKTAGGNFNITSNEWVTFFNRVNDFRRYKGLSNYSFTTPSSGTLFQAFYFNQARTAISAMSPSTSVPAIAVTGDIIYASNINRLRDSLNSIN